MVGFLRARIAGGDDELEAKYRASVVSQLQSRHLAGKLVPLDEVFVPTRLLSPQSGLTEGELLDDGTATLHYLWPELASEIATIPPPSVTLSEMLAHGHRILLSGEAGSGKSSLLAYCAILIAKGESDGLETAQTEDLPVHLHLADLEQQLALARQQMDWSDDPLAPLQEVLERTGFRSRGLERVLAAAAAEGRLFVLLDGWDEVPGIGLGRTGRWLQALLRLYPGTRVWMAGPTKGYGPVIRLGFKVVGLLPWRRGQAAELGRKWARAMGARHIPGLRHYWRPGQTPLVTWLRLRRLELNGPASAAAPAATIAKLMQREIEEALEAVFGKAERLQMKLLIWKLFQVMAYKMVQDRVWSLSLEDVRTRFVAIGQEAETQGAPDAESALELANASGLFVTVGDRVRFLNPVVRDYLAAQYMAEMSALEDAARLVQDGQWSKVVWFYIALLDSHDSIQKLAPLEPESESLYQIASWLPLVEDQESWRKNTLIALGRKCLDAESLTMARQRAAAALATTDDPGVGALMGQVIRQHQPSMRQAGLAVLARVAPEELAGAARRLASDSDAGVRAAAIHALAWTDGLPVRDLLLEALYSRDPIISYAAAEGLALNGTDSSYKTLREATRSREFGVRQAARAGLRLIAEPWAQALLTKSLTADRSVASRDQRSGTLLQKSDEEVAKWRQLRPGDQAWLVAWAVAEGHVVPVGQAAVPFLLEALMDDEATIRVRAAASLGQLSLLDGMGPLKQALNDESPEVRQAAFIALTKLSRVWDIDA